MSLDPATKEYLDAQFGEQTAKFGELLTKFDAQTVELARSNERSEALSVQVGELTQRLEAAETELEGYRAASVKDFTNCHERCDIVEDNLTTLKKHCKTMEADLTAQKGITEAQAIELDDLQQYGRRQSIRIQGVTVVEGEDDNDSLLLESVIKTLVPTGIVLSRKDIVRYHRSSAAKTTKYDAPNTKSSQVLVKLNRWTKRALFQGVNAEMRKREKKGETGCRVFHDLTKRRLELLNTARTDLEAAGIKDWFAYADINSGLKLRKDKNFHSFNTKSELDAAIAKIKGQN
jgi:hypothetical protein